MQNWRWAVIGTKQQGVIKAGSAMEALYLLQDRGIGSASWTSVAISPITDEEAAELWRQEQQHRMNAAFAAAIHLGMNRPRPKPQRDHGGVVLIIAMLSAVAVAIGFPGQAGLLIAAAIAAACVAYIVPE